MKKKYANIKDKNYEVKNLKNFRMYSIFIKSKGKFNLDISNIAFSFNNPNPSLEELKKKKNFLNYCTNTLYYIVPNSNKIFLKNKTKFNIDIEVEFYGLGISKNISKILKDEIKGYYNTNEDYFFCIHAMNYVQTNINTHGYAGENKKKYTPYLNVARGNKFMRPYICLKNNSGICKDHGDIFKDLCEHAGIKVRLIILSWKKNGHIGNHCITEAFINNKWVFFDITWGAIYLNNENINEPLSFEEIINLKNPREHRIMNNTNLWYIQWEKINNIEIDSYFDIPKSELKIKIIE